MELSKFIEVHGATHYETDLLLDEIKFAGWNLPLGELSMYLVKYDISVSVAQYILRALRQKKFAIRGTQKNFFKEIAELGAGQFVEKYIVNSYIDNERRT